MGGVRVGFWSGVLVGCVATFITVALAAVGIVVALFRAAERAATGS